MGDTAISPQELILIIGSVVVGMIVTIVLMRVIGRSLLSRARRDAAQTISNAEREAASDRSCPEGR